VDTQLQCDCEPPSQTRKTQTPNSCVQPALVKQCSTEELLALGIAPATVPIPLPPMSDTMSTPQRLAAAQAVISSVGYNHTRTCYFDKSKKRPYQEILETGGWWFCV